MEKQVDLKIRSEEVKSLGDIVYEKLKNAILSGRFPPGEKLSERKLANELGTSPMPVKQAVAKLQGEGIVTIKPRRGIFVSYFNEISFEEHFQIKAALQGLSARLAAKKATDTQLQYLSKLSENMKRYKNSKNINKLLNINKDFHDTIIAAGKNDFIENSLKILRTHILDMRKAIYKENSLLQSVCKEHDSIFEAINNGDEDLAELRMKKHVLNHKKRLIRVSHDRLPTLTS